MRGLLRHPKRPRGGVGYPFGLAWDSDSSMLFLRSLVLLGRRCTRYFMEKVGISKSITGAKGHRLKSLTVFGGGIVAIYYLYTFNPASSPLYLPCPFHMLTGFHCPGCGSLRALHHVLHGHLTIAFWLNPLMVLALPFLGYSFLSYLMVGIRGRSLPNIFLPASCIWIYLGVVLLFWGMRNISTYPFSLLAP
jgi:hypothetical protein